MVGGHIKYRIFCGPGGHVGSQDALLESRGFVSNLIISPLSHLSGYCVSLSLSLDCQDLIGRGVRELTTNRLSFG